MKLHPAISKLASSGLDILLDTPCTITRKVQAVSDFGPESVTSATVSVLCSVSLDESEEKVASGSTAQFETIRVFLPSGTILERDSSINIEGIDFEVDQLLSNPADSDFLVVVRCKRRL